MFMFASVDIHYFERGESPRRDAAHCESRGAFAAPMPIGTHTGVPRSLARASLDSSLVAAALSARNS